jgi:uncharacterized protein (DUF433 family)
VTAVFTTHTELDGYGVAWIGGTTVKVIEVMLDKSACGWSPEEIHFHHPHLSLAQIHAALTYYYENQDVMDAQIRRGLEESDELAAQLSDPRFRKTLRDLKRSVSALGFYSLSSRLYYYARLIEERCDCLLPLQRNRKGLPSGNEPTVREHPTCCVTETDRPRFGPQSF